MSPTVLVVGAGIAGLATARALHRHGLECRVVERRAHRSTPGYGPNLPGNAVAALHTLDAADHVRARGVPVARREYRTHRGRLTFAVDEAQFWSQTAGSLCARHEAVWDALADGIVVEEGMALASLEWTGQGRTFLLIPIAPGEVYAYASSSRPLRTPPPSAALGHVVT